MSETCDRCADPDTLIIRRDAAGNWPLGVLNAIGEKAKVDPWLIQSIVEDALLEGPK